MKINKKINALIALGLIGGLSSVESFADETPIVSTPNEEKSGENGNNPKKEQTKETEKNITKDEKKEDNVVKPLSDDVKTRIKPEDIKKEVIVQHGKFDFSDNIKTPNIKKIEVISQPDPGVLGTFKAEVKVIFNDDKETTVPIETIVVENEEELKKVLGENTNDGNFQDHIKSMLVTINVVQGDSINYSKALTKYDSSWKIDVIKSVDTSTHGNKTARIKVTNKKGETAEVDVSVSVIEKKNKDNNKENEKEKPEDKNKDDNKKVNVREPVIETNTQNNNSNNNQGKGEPIKGEVVKTGDAATIGFGATSILGGLGVAINHLRKRK